MIDCRPSVDNRWKIRRYSLQMMFHHEQPFINCSVLRTLVCGWSDCCLITVGNQRRQLLRHGFGYRLREFQLFGRYQFVFCVISVRIALEQAIVSGVNHRQRISPADGCIVHRILRLPLYLLSELASVLTWCRLVTWFWHFKGPRVFADAMELQHSLPAPVLSLVLEHCPSQPSSESTRGFLFQISPTVLWG